MRPIARKRGLPRHAAALLACGALAAATLEVGPGPAPVPALARARADDAWLAEFEAVCSKTQDAMTLSTGELRDLIARCDALRPKIAALDEPRRKVYSKRLQLCRDLYDFVLQSRSGT